MKNILLRVVLLMPWAFLLWLILRGISGEIDGLLVFALLFILIPGAIVLNLITVVAFQGHSAIKMIRQMQKKGDNGPSKLSSENYADLPWWNPKKYKK